MVKFVTPNLEIFCFSLKDRKKIKVFGKTITTEGVAH